MVTSTLFAPSVESMEEESWVGSEEKNQPRRPTCPPGFSDIPQVLINNIDSDQDKTSNDQPKIPTVVEGLQDIIENWRGEYAMGSVGQYSWF